MIEKIDARGLLCPQPVLKTKEVVESSAPAAVEVVVDNRAARENVCRFLGSCGYGVTVAEEGKLFRITGSTDGVQPAVERTPVPSSAETKTLVLVMSDTFGSGSDELGRKLMVNYLKTLREMEPNLWQLIFVNGGVRLSCEDSPVFSDISDYERAGITVLSCGTCVEFFGLEDRKRVGGLTNMLDIVMATENADKVISLS